MTRFEDPERKTIGVKESIEAENLGMRMGPCGGSAVGPVGSVPRGPRFDS